MKNFLKLLAIIIFCFLSGIAISSASSFDGPSMEPTLYEGDMALLNPFDKNVAINDIISLDRITDTGEKVSVRKRVTDMKDGCIWIEGDNTDDISYDSRDYGWLCEGQYEIKATQYPLTFINKLYNR